MLKFLFFYLTIFYLKDFFSIIYKRVKFCSTETLLTDGFVHPDQNLKIFYTMNFPMLSGDLFPVKNCSLLESNRGD